MIRVLHIVSSVNKDSGVMNFIMNYYKNLDKKKIQFDFLFWEEDYKKTFANEIIDFGGTLYKISKPKISRNSFQILNDNIVKFAETGRIIHLHELYLNSIVKKILNKQEVSLISHAHTTKYSDKLVSSLRNRILCFNINKNSDYYFACSLDAGDFYFSKNFNVNSKKSNIISNAIDLDLYKNNNELREKKRNEMQIVDKTVFGHIGRFNHQKNHKLLIDIFYEIQKKIENAVLVLVGDGPLKKNIEEKVEKLGISKKVLFMGTRNDVNEIIQSIDVFLLPSHYEGLGIVLIEAQASGVPCVASDVIPKEVAISENIYFEKINSKNSTRNWSEKAIYLTKKSSNRKKNIAKSHNYNIKKEVKKLEDIYLEIYKHTRR